ncbi:ribosome biogenesis regulatory protein homolog [Schistocerca americana]|uniref:ribosome biogenesis regulatory protein homolog n=1 Tax=Schistocerca americana TaxID=7009 RepID=UPI001F4FA6C8|nr:ribosome biogenesis regulatory protein homolog [Schistocerca americana]
MNMDVVSEVLQKAKKASEKFKPTDVEKHLELQFDIGTLLAVDTNEIDIKKLRNEGETYLQNLARDNTQLLLNRIWELPTERTEEAVVAKLPAPSYILPRQLPVPKPKAPTVWEKFAKEKGIKKKKTPKKKWDDILKKWVPLYGYRRAAAEKERDWVLEVPQNADPMEDQFSKKAEIKVERVSKNEFQRLRNLAASKNIRVPRVGLPPTETLSSSQLGAAVSVAKASTASVGKFQAKLPKEKQVNKLGPLLQSGKKRKPPPPRPDQEKKMNLEMVDSILKKRPKLDIEKAVNRQIFQEQQERSEERKNQKPKKGGKRMRDMGNQSKKGKGSKNRSGAKPRSNKGSRKPNKNVGRKRR